MRQDENNVMNYQLLLRVVWSYSCAVSKNELMIMTSIYGLKQ